MDNHRIQAIEESEFGVYVWETPEGKILADEEYRQLSIPAVKGDAQKIMVLKNAAHGYMRDMGWEPGGRPRFLSGRRQVDDETYEEQLLRARAGLIPDKYDVAAIKEQAKYAKKN